MVVDGWLRARAAAGTRMSRPQAMKLTICIQPPGPVLSELPLSRQELQPGRVRPSISKTTTNTRGTTTPAACGSRARIDACRKGNVPPRRGPWPGRRLRKGAGAGDDLLQDGCVAVEGAAPA